MWHIVALDFLNDGEVLVGVAARRAAHSRMQIAGLYEGGYLLALRKWSILVDRLNFDEAAARVGAGVHSYDKVTLSRLFLLKGKHHPWLVILPSTLPHRLILINLKATHLRRVLEVVQKLSHL